MGVGVDFCRSQRRAAAAWVLVCTVIASSAAAESWPRGEGGVLTPREGVGIASVGVYGRQPVQLDPIAAAVAGRSFERPEAGDAIPHVVSGEERVWREVTADAEGRFDLEEAVGPGGYVHLTLELDEPRTLLLDAAGNNIVYVNGTPLAGDTYSDGTLLLPVELEEGENDLLFHVARGRLRVQLRPVESAVMFSGRDDTVFDPLVGEAIDSPVGVVVINATDAYQDRLAVRVSGEGLSRRMTGLPPIPPMTVRKLPVSVTGEAARSGAVIEAELELLDRARADRVVDRRLLELTPQPAGAPHRRTFISLIDESVQYYAVRSASGTTEEAPGLVLTLHGAGVEAIDHVSAYAPNADFHLVAPTNRRPFGFDWEDWGRLDAMEVLDLALVELNADPRRVHVTGHSMGGHGAYHLGVTHPGRFATVAPSGGWVSMFTYPDDRLEDVFADDGEEAEGVGAVLRRAMNPSDTMALRRNLAHAGVYMLHGEADATVPVEHARAMREALGRFHPDFSFYEQPGASHWWNGPRSRGVDAVDWPPMFETFAFRSIPQSADVEHVHFATAKPAVSATLHWATIYRQRRPLAISRVDLRRQADDTGMRLVGDTENVAVLRLDAAAFESPLRLDLDGHELELTFAEDASRVTLVRDGEEGGWREGERPAAGAKGPERAGPFKAAFGQRMVFVYATRGSRSENAWAYAKARFDAQTFYYRGNGDVQLVPDVEYDAAEYRGRSVILYGHAESNAAWDDLLADSPIQVRPFEMTLGDRTLEGEDLAALFVRPHPGSDSALVGVVTGTTAEASRWTDRLPYFISAVAYPDYMIFDGSTLTEGLGGVREAGFFNDDWALE